MADEEPVDDTPVFDKTAYVGVDPMYQNAANPTEYPLVPPEQEGVLMEGEMVREVPSVVNENQDLGDEWLGISPSGREVPEGSSTDEPAGDASSSDETDEGADAESDASSEKVAKPAAKTAASATDQ